MNLVFDPGFLSSLSLLQSEVRFITFLVHEIGCTHTIIDTICGDPGTSWCADWQRFAPVSTYRDCEVAIMSFVDVEALF